MEEKLVTTIESTDKPEVKVSVRSLVEFLLRSGDITPSRGGFADREAMQAGSRVHRRTQKKRGAGYRPEVRLSRSREYENVILTVEGRADGIFMQDSLTVIEEIKGVYQDLDGLDEPFTVHLAQAKCYAAITARDQDLQRIGVQMTYINIESDEEKIFHSTYGREEIEEFLDGLMNEYAAYADFQIRWKKERDASIHGMPFPFPYRPGQREMAVYLYRTIAQGKEIFIQAPTGTGKTMSAVFPSVHALASGLAEKIFYLTARTTTRTAAEEAFRILCGKGLRARVLTITSKEKICVCDEAVCDPEYCPRAKGHYDRINACLLEMLAGETLLFDRPCILRVSEAWMVCPFELQLDLSWFMDAVICDYNYVFDPNAKLRRYFGEGARRGDYVYLVDEAHNLLERGREMYSAELCKEEFLALRRKCRGRYGKLERALTRTNSEMLRMKKECLSGAGQDAGRGSSALRGEICREWKDIDAFVLTLMNLAGQMEDVLQNPMEREERDSVLELYFKVMNFLSVCDLLDENYILYHRVDGSGSYYLKLLCVNPASNLQAVVDRGRSAAFFSATFHPIPYYESFLSTREDNYRVELPSPFPRKNRRILVATDVSTLYRRRTQEEFRRIAAYIQFAAEARSGNYLVFFPSYRLMEDVLAVYRNEFAGEKTAIYVQEPGMTEAEREEFLRNFSSDSEVTRIGFCIMGGIFSEGIDLSGERLIGAIVVGTGLPQVTGERELLRTYYDRMASENGQTHDGFFYSYSCPGMNKVTQAAGRVIRTAEDVGVILLLDERFARREYEELFPPEWRDRRFVNLRNVSDELRSFWEEMQRIP